MSLLPTGDGGGDALNHVRWLTVMNDSGDEVPPHALLRITDNDPDGVPLVNKPNADSMPFLLVNGPLPIVAGGTGIATYSEPVPVAYDDAATPALGDTWGSASGSWLLTTGKAGWRVMSAPTGYGTVEAARAGGATLTTGNVGDSGAQDSTTSVLRFDEDTGVRVDKGATDADADVVSLVFSETLNVVTNVCEILDVYGAISGIRVEYTPVTFPTGTTFGSRVCVESPDDCCPPTMECVGCPDKIVPPLTLSFTAKTGDATCLPASVALEFVESVSTPGSLLIFAPTGYSLSGVLNWPFCGGTYTTFWGFQISCRVGTPGYDIFARTSSDNILGGSFPDSPLGGLESGAAGTRLNYSGGHDCDLFDAPGAIVLGTVTNPGSLTSTVTVTLSW